MSEINYLGALAATIPPAIALIFLYTIFLAIYRLYLSPISNIPGPKLAAATYLYEIYYDIIKKGYMFKQLQTLHEQYGPIIRINPHEVHINDPDFFTTIYSSERRDKSEYHTRTTPNRLAAFGTTDHDLHRRRRAVLNPFFSKGQIRKFAPWIQQRADVLCRRLDEEYKGTDKVLVLNDAFACFTADNIMRYSFGEDHKYIEIPDFEAPVLKYIGSFFSKYHFAKHFPWLLRFQLSLPPALLGWLFPLAKAWREDVTRQVDLAMSRETKHSDLEHVTIFSEILNSTKLNQDSSKDEIRERLRAEARTVVSAGTDTTATTLATAMYYILANPAILATLKAELREAIPDPGSMPPLSTLENLPYLSAVIAEATRLYALSSRSPRISREDITYTNPLTSRPYLIPAGTPMGTSIFNLHRNAALFPEPEVFLPDRWLDDPVTGSPPMYQGKLLRGYLVPFSKGTRSCLGMHLANAQIVILLASLLRKNAFLLWETEVGSVRAEHDWFLPFPREGMGSVRVVVV